MINKLYRIKYNKWIWLYKALNKAKFLVIIQIMRLMTNLKIS